MPKSKKSESADETQTSKKTRSRRPLWLCVPVEFDVTVDDGAEKKVPKTYEIWECHSKAEVSRILAAKNVSAATVNDGNIKLFRAAPMQFKITSQVTIKF
jgi:hypothetical protein